MYRLPLLFNLLILKSYEPVTFLPRSLLCKRYIPYRIRPFSKLHTFGPIQMASSMGDQFATVTSKLFRAQARFSKRMFALK